jgi:hypothetical protein
MTHSRTRNRSKTVTGFYNTPVVKMVPPLRQTALNNFENDIKNGRYSLKDFDHLKSIAFTQLSKTGQHVLHDQQDYFEKRRSLSLHENPYFKNVWEAMKKGNSELK